MSRMRPSFKSLIAKTIFRLTRSNILFLNNEIHKLDHKQSFDGFVFYFLKWLTQDFVIHVVSCTTVPVLSIHLFQIDYPFWTKPKFSRISKAHYKTTVKFHFFHSYFNIFTTNDRLTMIYLVIHCSMIMTLIGNIPAKYWWSKKGFTVSGQSRHFWV